MASTTTTVAAAVDAAKTLEESLHPAHEVALKMLLAGEWVDAEEVGCLQGGVGILRRAAEEEGGGDGSAAVAMSWSLISAWRASDAVGEPLCQAV